MITADMIITGCQFKTRQGIVWIIDEIEPGELVRTSMKGGKKGNYRDPLNDVVLFLNEQGAAIIDFPILLNEDTDPVTCTFTEFIRDNSEGFDMRQEFAQIADLKVNETITLGGGAFAQYTVKRIS